MMSDFPEVREAMTLKERVLAKTGHDSHGLICAETKDALRAIIEAHEVFHVSNPRAYTDTWKCQGCSWRRPDYYGGQGPQPECPNGQRAVALAAHHLGIEDTK